MIWFNILGRFSGQISGVQDFGELMDIFVEDIEDTQEYQEPWKRNTITLMVGLPCSGKSVYTNSNKTSEIVISRDALIEKVAEEESITYNEAFHITGKELDREVNNQINEAIKNKQDIIIDKTHMSPKSRRRSMARIPSKSGPPEKSGGPFYYNHFLCSYSDKKMLAEK